jgi:hypothetical protein
MIRNIDVTVARAFLTVLETGSVTLAASRCPSAVGTIRRPARMNGG